MRHPGRAPCLTACPARRAALSVVVVAAAIVANPTLHATASPKVRSLALPCLALPCLALPIGISPLGPHTAYSACVGVSIRPAWRRPSLLHARTTRSRSNLRLACRSACNSRTTCSSIASHFDLRPLRRCHHTNSPAVRARRLTSIDCLTDSFSAASVAPFCP